MFLAREILRLLTTDPGGLAYYFVLLFSIWTIVGLALSRWARGERAGSVPRLLVAGAVMSFSRLAFFAIALVENGDGALSPGYVVLAGPPLERFLDALSIVLIGWAIVVASRHRTFGRVFLGVALFLVVVLYLLTAVQWASSVQVDPQAAYNRSWHRWAWEAVSLALLLFLAGYAAAYPIRERGTVLVVLLVLAVAHVLQALVPLAEQFRHFPAWVRLGNLLAYPLFAVIAFQLMVARFDAHAARLQSTSRQTVSQVTGWMELAEGSRRLYATLEPEGVIENALHSASDILHADRCAIALLDPDQPASAEMSVVGEEERHRFEVDAYPAIALAIARNSPLSYPAPSSAPDASLHGLLGVTGPLLVEPLATQAGISGVLLIGRGAGDEGFAPAEASQAEALARQTAQALENARQYGAARSREASRQNALQGLESDFMRTRADLENRLRQAQDEIAVYVQKLYETELAEQRAQDDANELRSQLKVLHGSRAEGVSQPAPPPGEEDTDERAAPDERIAALEAARDQLESQMESLKDERSQLRVQLARAQTSVNMLRTRTGELEAAFEDRGDSAGAQGSALALDVLSLGVVLCDAEGTVTHVNRKALAILGGADCVGKPAASLWDDATWQDAVGAVLERRAAQTALLRPIVVQRASPEVRVSLHALRAGQQQAGAVLVMRERPEEDDETRARDAFLSSVAQDLRTPMTSIVGYTELLTSESVGKLEVLQRKFLQRVQANIERMGAMLNDLIGVTTIDSGRLRIELETVEIPRVLERALVKAQFRLEERELQTEVDLGPMDSIQADPECVQQMIDNLLTNACTSSTAGTTIQVAAHQETDQSGRSHLHVSITDTGGGIAPEDRARVFERFYRADKALIAGLGETGVGLAIVRALVEAHRGHIWIETEMGTGTTFHFTLPYGLEETLDTDLNNRAVSPGVGGRG